METLTGTVALVTGSSRGIGRAIALNLAEAGCDICIAYLNSARDARDVAEEISGMGRRVLAVKADLSESDDIEALVESIAQEFGRLDILVSNAAGGGFASLMEASLNQFDYSMRINVRALMLLAQHSLPLLKKTNMRRSKLISVSSLGGTRALPHYGLIGAAKGAIESMTRHLALELGPQGVNVNCVVAGLVNTGALSSHPQRDEMIARRRSSLVADGEILPTDVAEAVRFLVCPLSDKIQGQTVVVDAGNSILA